MAGEFNIKVSGSEALKAELEQLAPELRRGPGRRALVKGAEPVLARAIQETPILSRDVYRRGKLYRARGTLRNTLRIRSSKDVNKTGDVGVIVNVKPLNKGAVADYKAATGRASSSNPNDPFYWRWVHFATKKNKNPKPFLTRAGEAVLQSVSLPLITDALAKYFATRNSKAGKK